MQPIFHGSIIIACVEISDAMRAQLTPDELTLLEAKGGKGGKGIDVTIAGDINAAGMGQVFGSLMRSLFDGLENNARASGTTDAAEILAVKKMAFQTVILAMGITLDSMTTVQSGGKLQ